MPKITMYGGHSNIGLTEKSAGFTDDTTATLAAASVSEPEQEPDAGMGDELDPDDVPEPPPFDPSDYSVSDVIALLGECTDDERDAVVALERAGKNRAGIVGK